MSQQPVARRSGQPSTTPHLPRSARRVWRGCREQSAYLIPPLHPLLRFGLRPCLQRPSQRPPLQPGSVCPSTCWTSPARPHQDLNNLPPETCLGRAAPSPAVPTSPHPCSAGDTVTRSPLSCLKPVPLTSLEPPPGLPDPTLHHSLAAHNTPALPISAGVRPGPSAAPLCPLPPLPSSWSGLAALPLWHHTPLGSWSPWPGHSCCSSSQPLLHCTCRWREAGGDGDRRLGQAFLAARDSGADGKDSPTSTPAHSASASQGRHHHRPLLTPAHCTAVWPETARIPILALCLMAGWHQESHLTSLIFQFFICKMR